MIKTSLINSIFFAKKEDYFDSHLSNQTHPVKMQGFWKFYGTLKYNERKKVKIPIEN